MKRSEIIRQLIIPIIEEHYSISKGTVGKFHRCSWVDGSFKWFVEVLNSECTWRGETVGCYMSMENFIKMSKNYSIEIRDTGGDSYFDFFGG